MRTTTLSAAEAAARLGVKRASLYAYVSRGLLDRQVADDGRSSRFAVADVEHLLAERRHGRPASTSIDLTVTTGITRLTDDGVWYRGTPLADIVGTWSFERTAEWLWHGVDPGPSLPPWPAGRGLSEVAARLGAGAHRLDALVALTAAVAATDRTRSPATAADAARRTIGAFADHVPPPVPAGGRQSPRSRRPRDRSIAARLAAGLGARMPADELVPLVDAVLVCLADHDLASSTLAARIAASTRADGYGVILAGLGVLAGPLHGAASAQVHRFLADAERSGSVATTVDALLRAGARLPGFGHKIYRGPDPRYALLVGALRDAGRELAVLADVVAVAADRRGLHPNVDLAIGAITLSAGLPPDTGEVLFAVARTAGWIAHAIEEYDEAPVRYRPRSVYVGPGR
jgi:citrate synthase